MASSYPGSLPQPWVMSVSGPATPGGAGPRVNSGVCWNASAASSEVSLGSARLAFLAKTDDTSLTQYLISDSATGAHAWLLGFSQNSNGKSLIEGDIYKGPINTAFSFTSPSVDQINPGQWVFGEALIDLSAGDDLGIFYLYMYGICVYVKNFGTGTRMSRALGLDGNLYWFGSDHVNWKGSAAFATLWDCNKLAFPDGQTSGPTCQRAYWPKKNQILVQGGQYADAAPDFTIPGNYVVDRATGLVGVASSSSAYRGECQHPGVLEYSLVPEGREGTPRPLPQWILDPTCPLYQKGYPFNIPNAYIKAQGTTPTNALMFDDFSNRFCPPYVNEYPKLGATVGGSLGPLTWNVRADTTTSKFSWGVMSGCAIYTGQGDAPASPAFVDIGTADQDVQIEIPIDCQAGRDSTLFAGPAVVFRCLDVDNYMVGFIQNDGVFQLRKYVAGVGTDIGTTHNMPANYTALRILCHGSDVKAYGGTGPITARVWTLLNDYTDSTHITRTGCGVASKGGSIARIANIVAFAG